MNNPEVLFVYIVTNAFVIEPCYYLVQILWRGIVYYDEFKVFCMSSVECY